MRLRKTTETEVFMVVAPVNKKYDHLSWRSLVLLLYDDGSSRMSETIRQTSPAATDTHQKVYPEIHTSHGEGFFRSWSISQKISNYEQYMYYPLSINPLHEKSPINHRGKES